jgi:hypothetical protein
MCKWCEDAHTKGQKDYSRSGGVAKGPISEMFNPTYNPPNNYPSIRKAYKDGWNNAKRNPKKR